MQAIVETTLNPVVSDAFNSLPPSITVVENDSPAAKAFLGIKNHLEALSAEHQAWMHNACRTSNEQLYALLQKCYALYFAMNSDTVQAAALRRAFKEYMELHYPKVSSSTHTLVKIVRCVFGVDRRRVSAYGIVLRQALGKKKKVEDLPAFIRDSGGVEEIRLDKSPNAISAKEKVAIATTAVHAENLGVFVSTQLASSLDAGNIGKEVVLIGTWQADGSVIVRSSVQAATAVNAALAAFYGSNKDAVIKSVQQKIAANDEQEKQAAIAAAANSAVANG